MENYGKFKASWCYLQGWKICLLQVTGVFFLVSGRGVAATIQLEICQTWTSGNHGAIAICCEFSLDQDFYPLVMTNSLLLQMVIYSGFTH
jgi:hypothetical protein